jgi:Rad3-related DNA helicase
MTALPAWVTTIRPHQQVAVDEAMALFDAGKRVVFLDGPTGTGKTLIGELIRRQVGGSALYVCSDKALQDQFMADFPYARLLKGRANYRTEHFENVNCGECDATGPNSPCLYCDGHATCPYQVAKRQAMEGDLAVLNTAYLLTESNTPQPSFINRSLVIIDEADTLESAMMGYVEYQVPQWIAKKLKLSYPKQRSHKTTIVKWMIATIAAGERWLGARDETTDVKQRRNMRMFLADTQRVMAELQVDIDAEHGYEESGRWLRDYDTTTFRLRPVMVSSYGMRYLWRHGQRFLVMSATLISSDEMATSLGLPYSYGTVTVPMTFPVDNRPIIIAPVVTMTYRTMQDEETIDAAALAIINISEKHVGQRVLVHTASYKLTERLMAAMQRSSRPVNHNLYAYGSSAQRAAALEQYLADPDGMLFAASMSRGVDLKDDDCRVQIIAKIPFPSLGDRQVSARMRLPNGDEWYAVQTIRDIVQMTGRGVRSDTDWAVTYILDGQFGRVWSKNKRLIPGWWKEAVDQTQSMSWLAE